MPIVFMEEPEFLIHDGVGAPSADNVERSLNGSEFFRRLGLRVSFAADRTILAIDRIEDYHRGGTTGHSVNGGIQALMMDVVVGATAARDFPDMGPGSGVGRLEIRMQRPPEGDTVRAEAVVASIRRNVAYIDVRLFDAENHVCTRARGTVFIRRGGGATGSEPAPL